VEKERFEHHVKSSKPALDRVKVLIEEQLEDTDHTETSVKQFEDPNWAYLQAYKNGFKSALKILYKFVDLDSQKLTKEIQ